MKRLMLSLCLALAVFGCSGDTDKQIALAEKDAALIIGTATTSSACPEGPCGAAGAYAAVNTLYPALLPAEAKDQIKQILDRAPATLNELSNAATDAATRAADFRGVLSQANQIANILSPYLTDLAAKDDRVRAILNGFQAARILAPIIMVAVDQLSPASAPKAGARAQPTTDQAVKARAALRHVVSR